MAKIESLKDLFTQEFLCDLLSTASCGSFWFECGVHKDTPKEVYNNARKQYECSEDIWAYCLLHGGFLNIADVEECEEDKEQGQHKISIDDVINGLNIVMLNYPQMYAAIRDENYDLYDADAVIQCAVFGDVIYG